MKSNNCIYCDNNIKGKRRHFCSDICNARYWSGVYSKKWKAGDFADGTKPTKEELEKFRKRYKARQLAYKTYKLGNVIKCDLCKILTKNIHRHHENYDSPICMLLCPKCHGFIRRYNNLKEKYFTESKGG